MKPVFIIGYMASGKSTFGRALAKRLGCRFIDLDFYIEQRFRKKVAELFAERGEEGFRELESVMLQEICMWEDTVISCGGGTPCRKENMDYMLASGLTVWLDTDIEVMMPRLLRKQEQRPLVKGKSPEELRQFVTSHLEMRRPSYSRAEIRFSGNELDNRRQIYASIEAFLEQYPLEAQESTENLQNKST